MAAGVPSWLDAVASSAVVLAVLGFFGIRALNRIDALEKDKASKSELAALIAEMRADRQAAREDNQAASAGRAKLYERISTMAESLARLEGRIGNS